MKSTTRIYLLTVINFLVGTSQFVIAGILDRVALSAGVSVSTAGQLITAYALANAIGTPVVMVLISKLNRRSQLLVGLAIVLLGVISTLTLPGFGFLLVSRIILGIGSGVFVVTSYATAANLAPLGRRGQAMANIALGFSSSLVFGVPLGRLVAAAWGWISIFWILGALLVLGVLSVIRWIPKTESEAPIPLRQQLSVLKRPRVAFALTGSFFLFVGYSAVTTYITPLLSALLPMNEQKMSIILFGFGIASLIGSKAGGFFSDRWGTKATLSVSLAFQVIALLAVSALAGWEALIITVLLLWAAAAWLTGTTQNINLVSIAPEVSGILLSLASTFVQSGFAAGAGLGGIVLSGGSVLSLFLLGAAAVTVATGLISVSFFLGRPRRSIEQNRGTHE